MVFLIGSGGVGLVGPTVSGDLTVYRCLMQEYNQLAGNPRERHKVKAQAAHPQTEAGLSRLLHSLRPHYTDKIPEDTVAFLCFSSQTTLPLPCLFGLRGPSGASFAKSVPIAFVFFPYREPRWPVVAEGRPSTVGRSDCSRKPCRPGTFVVVVASGDLGTIAFDVLLKQLTSKIRGSRPSAGTTFRTSMP